jgi:hypothetical protein
VTQQDLYSTGQFHHPTPDQERATNPYERPRGPLIFREQQHQMLMERGMHGLPEIDDYSSTSSDAPFVDPSRRLSTITEKTERTEPSPYWPARTRSAVDTPRGDALGLPFDEGMLNQLFYSFL